MSTEKSRVGIGIHIRYLDKRVAHLPFSAESAAVALEAFTSGEAWGIWFKTTDELEGPDLSVRHHRRGDLISVSFSGKVAVESPPLSAVELLANAIGEGPYG